MEQILHGCALLGTNHIDADEREEDADGCDDHRSDDGTELHIAVHGKSGSSQCGCRKNGTTIALVKVGTHSGNITHIISYIIGNGSRIPGIIFRDVRLHLTHQVGSHIGSLGIDASSHSGKESLGRSTHSEGKHRGGDGNEGGCLAGIYGVQNNKPDGDIEQTESYHDKSHHGTAAEGYLQSLVKSCTSPMSCTRRSIGSRFHSEEACQSGEETTRKECERNPRILHFQHVSHEGEDDGEHHEDDGHHLVLLLEISHRTFSYMRRNLFHSVGSLIFLHHRTEEEPCHTQCYNAGYRDEPKY